MTRNGPSPIRASRFEEAVRMRPQVTFLAATVEQDKAWLEHMYEPVNWERVKAVAQKLGVLARYSFRHKASSPIADAEPTMVVVTPDLQTVSMPPDVALPQPTSQPLSVLRPIA